MKTKYTFDLTYTVTDQTYTTRLDVEATSAEAGKALVVDSLFALFLGVSNYNLHQVK